MDEAGHREAHGLRGCFCPQPLSHYLLAFKVAALVQCTLC